MKNNQPLNAQAVKNKRTLIHNDTPLYHTEWKDKDGRTTRKGFLDGCIERFDVKGREGATVMIRLVRDQFDNAAKYFYAVECSDHFRLWGELPYAQQEKNNDIGMHTTSSLKEARKACTYFRSGKLKKDGKFQ